MDFIKKILNPTSLPFYRKRGNDKYTDILKFKNLPENNKYNTKRIIQEIKQNNNTVVSVLDCDLNYIFINKYGLITEIEISKSRFVKSTKLHFERCNKSLSEIMELENAKKEFISKNGVRITFLTDNGNYSISGEFDELGKKKIIGQTISHFLGLTYLHNPKKYNRMMRNEIKEYKKSR